MTFRKRHFSKNIEDPPKRRLGEAQLSILYQKKNKRRHVNVDVYIHVYVDAYMVHVYVNVYRYVYVNEYIHGLNFYTTSSGVSAKRIFHYNVYVNGSVH